MFSGSPRTKTDQALVQTTADATGLGLKIVMNIDRTLSLIYLCVCGESVRIQNDEETSCPRCGRIRSEFSQTNSMTHPIGGIENEVGAIAVQSSDELLGQTLDHFTLVERLGHGGMGNVYRALDESLLRYVAIKVLRGVSGAKSTQSVKRLLEEARAQARLNHPNIVQIYYVSRDPNRSFIAMELMPSGTLENRLKIGSLSYGEVIEIASQIVAALEETSSHNIVHGDIKPSNILLNGKTAKLSDFGLAQQVDCDPLSSARSLAGTPDYMAPESFTGGSPTVQADMYSFGIMLFEMTFSRLPYTFSANDLSSRIEAHRSQSLEFPAKWPANVPIILKPFLSKLLAKLPSERFSDWHELKKQIYALRPLKATLAGGFQRGIAWLIDVIALAFCQILILGATISGAQLVPNELLGSLVIIGSVLIVPLLVMTWIALGGSSLGKSLLQLRVVDRYGLPLGSRTLAQRSIVQFLPLWLLPTSVRTDTVGLPDWIWQPLWVLMVIYLLFDFGLAILRRGRSLHDQLFDTKVILAPSNESSHG